MLAANQNADGFSWWVRIEYHADVYVKVIRWLTNTIGSRDKDWTIYREKEYLVIHLRTHHQFVLACNRWDHLIRKS